MFQIKTKTILCLLIVLSIYNQIVQAQQSIKKVIRAGLEFSDYLSTNSGSFNKLQGLIFGYHTGVNIYNFDASNFLLGVDFNFTKTFIYRINVNYETTDHYWLDDYKYRYVYDEKFRLAFVQIGLHPGYNYSLNEMLTVGVYFGSSIGIGTEILESNFVSRTIIDSTNHYEHAMYGVHGEYNMDKYRLPITYDIGFSIFYWRLMFDFRFTYIDMNSKSSLINNTKNSYLQLGVVL